jgi:hypothetical protein
MQDITQPGLCLDATQESPMEKIATLQSGKLLVASGN